MNMLGKRCKKIERNFLLKKANTENNSNTYQK